MKQTFFLLLTLVSFATQAQLKTDSLKPVGQKSMLPATKPTVITKQLPAAGTQTKPTLTDADYYLAGAVIQVVTGNDNKEANTSTAFFYVRPRKSNWLVAYKLEEYANEIKANQPTDLRLDRAVTLTSAQNSLQYFKQNGLAVLISYCNKNFCTDAWKINSVSLTLEFKDANGNPAPNGFGSRTISFPVSSGTLGFVAGCNPLWITDGKMCGHSDQLQKMLLKTDEYFNPMPSTLLGWWKDDAN